jgi:hypothetical protein
VLAHPAWCALADLNQAVKLNANLANAYFNRAFVLREKGNLIQGLTDHDQTIFLEPGFADLRWRLLAETGHEAKLSRLQWCTFSQL